MVASGEECIDRYIREKNGGNKIDLILSDYGLGSMLARKSQIDWQDVPARLYFGNGQTVVVVIKTHESKKCKLTHFLFYLSYNTPFNLL
ncbi:MAG: hypothetical protein GEU26_15420 [Nitrososphaeraceae archaeon]|nr:hypothetical protein [Nitrososphaeraceae archaeon]